jgi:hypothetical protein
MTHLTANELEAVHRPVSTPTQVRDSASLLWRQIRGCAVALVRYVRQRAQARMEQSLPQADTLCRQLRRDILKIEARRLL